MKMMRDDDDDDEEEEEEEEKEEEKDGKDEDIMLIKMSVYQCKSSLTKKFLVTS